MRKKILFLITKSNFGGAQRYVFELATNLSKREYDVVVAFGGDGLLKKKLVKAGIRTISIRDLGRDVGVLKDVRAFAHLYTLLRTEHPDIVHLNSSKAVALGALAARLAFIPNLLIVCTIHGWPFLESRTKLVRAVLWFVSWVSALLSHRTILVSAHDATQPMPFLESTRTVIHTALPPIDFKPRERAREALFSEKIRADRAQDIWLVTTAELTPNKNLFNAIDAVDRFNARNEWKIFYTIIGDGELFDELSAYIRERGLGDQSALLGYVDNARSYLKAFDMFVLPSKKEGLPYALLEAGAAELPSIGARVGGIPEVIVEGTHGLLIDPDAIETITAALETFAFDPLLRVSCSEALAKRVADAFSLPSMLDATMRVYQQNP